MPLHYTPATTAGWLAIVHEPRLLVVDIPGVDTPDDAFIADAWAAIAEPTGFRALLDLLTSRGLAATPSFVLIEWEHDSSARVIVRGDATVVVQATAGESTLAGASVSTWIESTVADAAALTIALPSSTTAPALRLPLEQGAALVAALEVTASGQPTHRATASAAPTAAEPAAPVPAAEAVSPPEPAPEPARAPVPTSTPEPIDVGATIVVELPPPAVEPEATAPESDGYDYLFGETMHRSVSEAAVREPDDEDSQAQESVAQAGDHDGQTVLTSDIAKLRRKRQRPAVDTAPPPAAKLVLVLSSGEREPLDQPILVGRAPSVSQVSPGQLPRLLTLGGIDQDISRNHAQFALEGDTVVVTDLHSKNGTSIVLPGLQPQKLRAGEPTSVIVGTVIDLGGGISFTLEEEA